MDPWYLNLASAGNSYRTTHPRSLVAGGKSPERAGAISRDKRSSLAEYLAGNRSGVRKRTTTIGLRSCSSCEDEVVAESRNRCGGEISPGGHSFRGAPTAVMRIKGSSAVSRKSYRFRACRACDAPPLTMGSRNGICRRHLFHHS